jgi:hypothetical protein
MPYGARPTREVPSVRASGFSMEAFSDCVRLRDSVSFYFPEPGHPEAVPSQAFSLLREKSQVTRKSHQKHPPLPRSMHARFLIFASPLS